MQCDRAFRNHMFICNIFIYHSIVVGVSPNFWAKLCQFHPDYTHLPRPRKYFNLIAFNFQTNRVLATKSNFLISVSCPPDVVNL